MKIIQAQKDIIGIGSHNFIVLINDVGQEIAQLHGWQVKNGVVDVSGVGGQLQVRTDHTYNLNDPAIDRGILWEGTATEGYQLWEIAKDCAEVINDLNYDYNMFDTFGGHNSNAAASTLIECMDLPEIDLDGWSPGTNEIIIDTATIEHIRQENGRPKENQPYNPGSLPSNDPLVAITGSDQSFVI